MTTKVDVKRADTTSVVGVARGDLVIGTVSKLLCLVLEVLDGGASLRILRLEGDPEGVRHAWAEETWGSRLFMPAPTGTRVTLEVE